MNPDNIDTEKLGYDLANRVGWLIAFAALIAAAVYFPWTMAAWFIVGYAALRVLPKPAVPGIRTNIYAALVLATVAAACIFRTWAPIVWFAAGWAAFAATHNPE